MQWLLLRLSVVAISGFISSTIAGTTGFGGAILFHVVVHAWGLISLVASLGDESIVDLRATVGLVYLNGLFQTLPIAILSRHHIAWRLIPSLLIPAFLGIPMGILLLLVIPVAPLRVVLGGILLLVAAWRGGVLAWTHPGQPVIMTARYHLLGASLAFLSGLIGGLFGTAGPPLMVFVLVTHMPKLVTRATFSAYSMALLPVKVASGILGPYILSSNDTLFRLSDWPLLPALMLGSAAGVALGNFLHHRIPTEQVQRSIILLLLSSGLSMLPVPPIVGLGLMVFGLIAGLFWMCFSRPKDIIQVDIEELEMVEIVLEQEDSVEDSVEDTEEDGVENEKSN